MKKASAYFDEGERERIAKAVGEAEMKTSAEIVPVVATASGRYDRAEDVVGLWFGAVAMFGCFGWLHAAGGEVGDWGEMAWWVDGLILVVCMVVGFVAGTILAMRVGWLRRLFTSRREMEDEVGKQARQAFFDSSIHHTEGGTGILMYVSIFERLAVVLADQAVLEAVGQETLDELCQSLTDGFGRGEMTKAFCEAIRVAGEKAGVKLPRVEDDVNELSDGLVVLG